jgi:hypothetical protein
MLQVFRRTKPVKYQNQTPSYGLPTKLWIIVLEIVIYDAVSTYDECKPTDFPAFLLSWESNHISHQKYLSDIEQGALSTRDLTDLNVRLVCRAWFDMVNNICRRNPPCLTADRFSRFIDAVNHKIKSLRIIDSTGVWENYNLWLRPYSRDRNLLHLARNISTISVSLQKPEAYRFHDGRGFLPLLINCSEYFPNVRSLSVGSYLNLPASFISGLQTGYPQLASLRITVKTMEPCNLYLPNLKILEYNTSWRVLRLDFPALTHVSLRGYDGNYSNFFHRHYTRLQSLVIRSFGDGYVTSCMLDRYPSLCLFGTTTAFMQQTIRFFPTEEEHPLNHIWILDSTNDTSSTIHNVLSRLKGLKRLTINPANIALPQMCLIRIRCRMRGVSLIEMTGMNHSFLPCLS